MSDWRGGDAEVWLPVGAPDELVDFVEGRTSSVEIDTTDVAWLPPPVELPPFAEPSVVVDRGWTPTSVSFEIRWGKFGLVPSNVRAVIVDGALTVRTSGLSDATTRRLSAWVYSLNRALRAHHRQLDSFQVRGPTVRLTARSPISDARLDLAVPPPVALAGLWALRRPNAPAPPPWRQRSRPAKVLLVTAVLLICFGGAAVALPRLLDPGGDDESTSTTAPDPTGTTVTTSGPGATDVTETSDVSTTEPDVSVLGPEPPTPPPDSTTKPPDGSDTSDVTTTTERVDSRGPVYDPAPLVEDPTSTTTTSTTTTTTTTTISTVPSVPPELLETCGESDIRVDTDGNGIADACEELDYYVIELGLPPQPPPGGPTPPDVVEEFPPALPADLARTGSDNNVALQVGVLLILAGLLAMVAAHRRAIDDEPAEQSG